MKLGLRLQSTRHGFLEQSRESKRLGHGRSEPGKACFQGQHLENTKIRTLRRKSVSRVSDVFEQYQTSIDRPRGSTDKAIGLRDLLEVQAEASEQLMVESMGLMTSSIQ